MEQLENTNQNSSTETQHTMDVKPLDTNAKDNIITLIKGGLGSIPFVGSVISELFGTIIPNQRSDRIVKFIKTLSEKMTQIQQELFEQKLKNEHFNILIEQAFTKNVIFTITEERREYIASLIVNSLNADEKQLNESKYILSLLEQITDVEIIWLRYYLCRSMQEQQEFKETHKEIITNVFVPYGSSQETIDAKALETSYKNHLAQLGLLVCKYIIEERLKLPGATIGVKVPKINTFTKTFEIDRYEITDLGKLLLRQIGESLN